MACFYSHLVIRVSRFTASADMSDLVFSREPSWIITEFVLVIMLQSRFIKACGKDSGSSFGSVTSLFPVLRKSAKVAEDQNFPRMGVGPL